MALTTTIHSQFVIGVGAIRSVRSGLAATVLVALLILGTAVVLWETSMVAEAGYENARLQEQQRTVEHHVQELQAEVASLTSLDYIDVEARSQLGMEDAKSYLYVQVDPSLKGK